MARSPLDHEGLKQVERHLDAGDLDEAQRRLAELGSHPGFAAGTTYLATRLLYLRKRIATTGVIERLTDLLTQYPNFPEAREMLRRAKSGALSGNSVRVRDEAEIAAVHFKPTDGEEDELWNGLSDSGPGAATPSKTPKLPKVQPNPALAAGSRSLTPPRAKLGFSTLPPPDAPHRPSQPPPPPARSANPERPRKIELRSSDSPPQESRPPARASKRASMGRISSSPPRLDALVSGRVPNRGSAPPILDDSAPPSDPGLELPVPVPRAPNLPTWGEHLSARSGDYQGNPPKISSVPPPATESISSVPPSGGRYRSQPPREERLSSPMLYRIPSVPPPKATSEDERNLLLEARSLVKSGRTREASPILARIEAESASPELQCAAARLLMEIDMPVRALNCVMHARDMAPSSPQVKLSFASIVVQAARLHEMEDLLPQAREALQGFTHANYSVLAEALSACVEARIGSPETALSRADQALQRDRQSIDAMAAATEALSLLGRNAEASEMLDKLTGISPRDAIAVGRRILR